MTTILYTSLPLHFMVLWCVLFLQWSSF